MTLARKLLLGADAAAAFPVVEATNTSFEGSTTSTHTVALPSGITAGELLIISAAIQTAGITITGPSGWTQLATDEQVGATTGVVLRIWYKIASGSEGSTVTFGTSAARQSAHHSYRISGYSGAPEAAIAKGSTAAADPPNLTPSWGSKKTLWLSAMALRPGSVVISSQPSNYTNFLNTRSTSTSLSVRAGSSRRELAASSENPGAFTLASSTDWVAATIAIRPA